MKTIKKFRFFDLVVYFLFLIIIALLTGCQRQHYPLAKGISEIADVDGTGGLIWSPDGKYIAGLIRKMPDVVDEPYSEIFLVDTDTWQKTTVLKTKFSEKDISTISWLTDSKHIAYTNEGSDTSWGIRSISIDGKSDVELMIDNGYPLWHPTRPLVAIRDKIGTPPDWYPVIRILDLSTKVDEQIFKGNEPLSDIRSLSWSSDGKTLAFVYGKIGINRIKNNVFLFDLQTKKITQFANDENEYLQAYYSPTDNFMLLLRHTPSSDYKTILRNLSNSCEAELPIPFWYSFASWSPDGKKYLFLVAYAMLISSI